MDTLQNSSTNTNIYNIYIEPYACMLREICLWFDIVPILKHHKPTHVSTRITCTDHMAVSVMLCAVPVVTWRLGMCAWVLFYLKTFRASFLEYSHSHKAYVTVLAISVADKTSGKTIFPVSHHSSFRMPHTLRQRHR